MRESLIESYLRKLVIKHGGACFKWVSPGEAGVPDRIVFFSNAVFLVETKSSKGKKARVLQLYQHRRLASFGFEVVILNSKERVKGWVEAQTAALLRDLV